MWWVVILVFFLVVIVVACVLKLVHRSRHNRNYFVRQKKEPKIIDEEQGSRASEEENIVNENIKNENQEKTKKSIEDKNFIIVRLVSDSDHPFFGYELLQSLLSSHFFFGKQNLFHRHENEDGTGKILFSVSLTDDLEHFEIQDIGKYSCTVLTLFMSLRGDEKNFDDMLDTAHQLRDDLGGCLIDEKDQEVSQEIIDTWKNKIYQYERGKQDYSLFEGEDL